MPRLNHCLRRNHSFSRAKLLSTFISRINEASRACNRAGSAARPPEINRAGRACIRETKSPKRRVKQARISGPVSGDPPVSLISPLASAFPRASFVPNVIIIALYERICIGPEPLEERIVGGKKSRKKKGEAASRGKTRWKRTKKKRTKARGAALRGRRRRRRADGRGERAGGGGGTGGNVRTALLNNPYTDSRMLANHGVVLVGQRGGTNAAASTWLAEIRVVGSAGARRLGRGRA